MDVRSALQIIAGLMTASCAVPYVRAIRRGDARPQRTSWFIFAVLTTVAAVAQLVDGASAGAFLAVGAAISFTTIFALSVRHGEGGSGVPDAFAMVLLVVGLVGWWATDDPFVAVVAVILGELPAVVLTVMKTWKQPSSEAFATWVIDGAAGVIAAATVWAWHVELVYPVWHIISNATVVVTVLLGNHHLRRQGAAGAERAVETAK